MAYQARREKKIAETLELVNNDGTVSKKIEVNLNADSIARSFRDKQNELIRAEMDIKHCKDKGEYDKILETFGSAMLSIFELIFGAENTAAILEFYENNYVEMATQIMPFISDVIVPAVDEAFAKKREQLANNYNLSKKQKRFLGMR